MLRRTAFVLGALAAVSACDGEETAPPAPPPITNEAVELPRAADENADPSVFELTLEARPADKQFGTGPSTPVWSYNGTVPGPLIEAKVGDKLVIHFKSSLDEETTIHWHGIR